MWGLVFEAPHNTMPGEIITGHVYFPSVSHVGRTGQRACFAIERASGGGRVYSSAEASCGTPSLARRALTPSARVVSRASVSAQPMQASVMLWPYTG